MANINRLGQTQVDTIYDLVVNKHMILSPTLR